MIGPQENDPASAITRGAMRLFFDLGHRAITEFSLGNGRRADIAALDRNGKLAIIEVKSGAADFRADHKWMEYLGYCDLFYFAVCPEFPLDLLLQHPGSTADIGIIVADRFGATIRREAGETPIAAARRRALTLRFARHAASRLQQQQDSYLLSRRRSER